MAEEEELDLELEQQNAPRKRVEHRIEIREHDTGIEKTAAIVELAQTVLDTLPEERTHKEIATRLKRKLDEVYGGTWHVIVGTHFGCNVTNDEETLVNFKVDGVYYLVLRSGPPERPNVPADAVKDAGSAAAGANAL